MIDLDVLDARRLVHAGASVQGHFADAIVVEFHPAPEHVHHLEANLVMMQRGFSVHAGLGADDVRNETAVGSVANAWKNGRRPSSLNSVVSVWVTENL
jgi:hypothetical protein